jgi:thiamine-monophosphate kinase
MTGEAKHLGDLGEFDLIDRMVERLGDAAAADILVPSGDDAAVWRGDPATVATIDALVEGTHWRADTTDLADVGWRAVAANVSDLAAMGARPSMLLVALMLGPTTTLGDIDALIDGFAASCREHGVRVAGGDVVRAAATGVSIAAYGGADLEGAPGEETALVMLRDAAVAGQRVAVSGAPGASAAGLTLIEAGRDAEPAAAPLVRAHRRPVARPGLGRAALDAGVRCAIDVSDGLLQDLGHIARRSGVGIELAAASLPLHPAARELLGHQRALDLCLGGGEDFELALVGDRDALRGLDRADRPVTLVGHVVDAHPGEVVVWDEHGEAYAPAIAGWDQLTAAPGARAGAGE